MGSAEIEYRVKNKLQAMLEQCGLGRADNPPAPMGKSGSSWVDVLPVDFDHALYTNAADTIIRGKFNVFNMKDSELGFPPDWLRDCSTGKLAPLKFGKALDYRDESIVGDIKYLWEPNRHLELVTLAQAWHLSGDRKYANACQALLDSWFKRNPYPLGPNWVSSLEHAVRLVNWSFAWHLLGSDGSVLFTDVNGLEFKHRWLGSIYQHCHFIAGHFSKFSSANNHLLGEYMGLFVASLTWPCWDQSKKWLELSALGFEQEVLKQNSEDGVNKEQGIWYHHEVVDMMFICTLFGRANDHDFSAAYWHRLERMLEFIASVMDVGGNVPMLGDSDDAVMVRLNPVTGNVYRSLLSTGAILFERGDFKHKADIFDDKSHWLLGSKTKRIFEQLELNDAVLPPRRYFPEGGYALLGQNFESDSEIRILADAGPLGYLSIAAHGHADALSFTLSVAGDEILVDSGTFAYHTQKKWRDYFRGTSAHNTVRIDGLDQSVSGGNFLWVRHASAYCSRFEITASTDIWEAVHDGYMRLRDPVKHHRTIILEKSNNTIHVKDVLSTKQDHFVEIYLHFSELCNVEVIENCAIVNSRNSQLSICLLNVPWKPELYSGCDEPPLGWISRGFDSKVPITTLRWAGTIAGKTEILTEIRIEKP